MGECEGASRAAVRCKKITEIGRGEWLPGAPVSCKRMAEKGGYVGLSLADASCKKRQKIRDDRLGGMLRGAVSCKKRAEMGIR